MVGWIPEKYRETFLLVPMPHGIEMVRGGVFGEFVHTYYHPAYAWAAAAALAITGMLLLADAKNQDCDRMTACVSLARRTTDPK